MCFEMGHSDGCLCDNLGREKTPEKKAMTKQQITDPCNRLIAETFDDGRVIELRTPMGQALGRYDRVSNQTTTMMNQVVGYGNVLMTLLR